jgi:hypothetical protein
MVKKNPSVFSRNRLDDDDDDDDDKDDYNDDDSTAVLKKGRTNILEMEDIMPTGTILYIL